MGLSLEFFAFDITRPTPAGYGLCCGL